MNADALKIIVTDCCCPACNVDTIQVHHQNFPEMHIEGKSAERAAEHLGERMRASLDSVCDPSQRAAVRQAIEDVQAFLNRKGAVHLARDAGTVAAR